LESSSGGGMSDDAYVVSNAEVQRHKYLPSSVTIIVTYVFPLQFKKPHRASYLL